MLDSEGLEGFGRLLWRILGKASMWAELHHAAEEAPGAFHEAVTIFTVLPPRKLGKPGKVARLHRLTQLYHLPNQEGF